MRRSYGCSTLYSCVLSNQVFMYCKFVVTGRYRMLPYFYLLVVDWLDQNYTLFVDNVSALFSSYLSSVKRPLSSDALFVSSSGATYLDSFIHTAIAIGT